MSIANKYSPIEPAPERQGSAGTEQIEQNLLDLDAKPEAEESPKEDNDAERSLRELERQALEGLGMGGLDDDKPKPPESMNSQSLYAHHHSYVKNLNF